MVCRSNTAAATAVAVAIYGVGLPAFVLQKVLQPLYFAREDTRRPFYYAVVAMILNAGIAIGLAPLIGYIAAAAATTVAGWAMVWQLWRGSRDMGRAAAMDDRLRRRAPRILLASLLMGAVLWVTMQALSVAFTVEGWRYLALLSLVLTGIISYFGVGSAIGAFHLSDFSSALKRNRAG